jgi:hypothetical protein
MTKHTEEPWMVMQKGFSSKGLWSAPTVYAADDELRYLAVCACADHMNFHSATDNLANAKRIAACVNACAGLSTEILEKLVASGQTLQIGFGQALHANASSPQPAVTQPESNLHKG